jgi:uncharacterized protein YdhG (YjbR/CyaY superfamily)
MAASPTLPEDYIQELSGEKKDAILKIREILKTNLPDGFEEIMSYGMLGYVVPHSLYPAGYHCTPSDPLPFIGLASRANGISLYHMGLYADPHLLHWFTEAWKNSVPYKLDMGKSCIRFKKPSEIPFDLLQELFQKMTPKEWIDLYESQLKKK